MKMALLLLLAAASLALLRSQKTDDSGYQSPAPFASEEEAMRKAEALDPGQLELEGPREVVVNSMAELTLRFRVGKAGMAPGGGIRIATAHGMGSAWGGDNLQNSNPRAENYLSFRASNGAQLQWTPYVHRPNPLLERFFPWQLIHEFKLRGPELRKGDWIEIRLGDRSGGSPGIRMPMWDETAFQFRGYVDAFGTDEWLPLRNNPRIRILAALPSEIHVIAPSEAEAGKPLWVNVWMGDGYGNPAAAYRGTVTLRAEGDAAGLPLEYKFRRDDQGAHRFEPVTFPRPGMYRILVAEKDGPLKGASNPVVVRATLPKERIYWGDIHTHTSYSDGRGSPAETYDFGKRVAALDFCAVSDHAFLVTDAMWEEIKKTTNDFYHPYRFVTFLAYEWSGQTPVGGDHNVYTSDADLPIYRSYSFYNYRNPRLYHGPRRQANHVEDLFRLLSERFRNENILVIPHFGGRPGNPAWHNAKLQRQIEIFSDHRRSEDWAAQFLARGYRIGIMASTDNHAGNAGFGVRRNAVERGEEGDLFSRRSPAERGTALVAAFAAELTRNAIFQALYHRRTYATTGSRILLRFEINGAPMGSELKSSGPPRIHVEAAGTAPLRAIRVVKNGKIIHAVQPGTDWAAFQFLDHSGDYQQKYYYIDLVQEDGEKAISSPIWLN